MPIKKLNKKPNSSLPLLAAVAAAAAASSSLKASQVAPTRPKATRYVDLGDTAPYSTWLNDPSFMKLETWFAEDQTAAPGVAAFFGLRNLKPILVKPDENEGNTWLITDGTSYWMFNELDGEMWKFKDDSLTLGMVVDLVVGERYGGDDLVEQARPKRRT